MRLALLVAGTTLPLIIFAAGIVFNNYEQDRRDATQRVLETVRSIRECHRSTLCGAASSEAAYERRLSSLRQIERRLIQL